MAISTFVAPEPSIAPTGRTAASPCRNLLVPLRKLALVLCIALLGLAGLAPAAPAVVYGVVANPGEDCSTQMNIGWHADTNQTDCFVTYTRKTDTGWAKAAVAQGTNALCTLFDGISSKTAAGSNYHESAVFLDYGASLTGLRPNTDYMYQIGAGSNTYSETRYFKTAGADEFSFVWISDIHAYTPLPGRLRSAVLAIDAAVALDPGVDFVLSTGDVTAWGGSYSFWTNLYAQRFVGRYMFAQVLGNHDNMTRNHDFNSGFFRVMNNVPPNGYAGQQGVCFWFLYHNVLFLTLNNEAMKKSPDDLAAAQSWAAGVIQSQKGRYRHVFLCQHYQWFYGQTSATSWYADWRDFCDKHGVALALAGNNHVYLRTHPLLRDQVAPAGKGTVYMQAPSSDGERGVEAGAVTNNVEKIACIYSSHTLSGSGMVKTIGCVLVKVHRRGITTRLVYLDDNQAAHVADEYTIPAPRRWRPSSKAGR